MVAMMISDHRGRDGADYVGDDVIIIFRRRNFFLAGKKSNVVDQFIIFGPGKNIISPSEKSRWPQPVRNSFCTESEHFAKKGKTYFLTLLDRSLLTFGEN